MPVKLLRLDMRYVMLPHLAGIDYQWWCPRCVMVVPETHAHEEEPHEQPHVVPTLARHGHDATQAEIVFDA